MPSFDTSVAPQAPVQLNALFDPVSFQNAMLTNQGMAARNSLMDLQGQSASQDLADRATLRGLAPGLTAGPDGTRNPSAVAQAVTLGANGVAATNALSNQAAQTAQTKLALLSYANSIPTLPSSGSGGAAGSGAAAGVGSGEDGFLNAIGGAESTSNLAAKNKQGFLGQFQFGTGRLTDLGMYTPAQNEVTANNTNQWQGTFNIPGFPQVKNEADFTQGPVDPITGQRNPAVAAMAQRAAAHVHFNNIAGAIQDTPGADQFSFPGLLAVAHLGGISGMRNFVKSDGAFDPGDNPNAPGGGTHLSDYYNRFGHAAGLQQLAAEHGHPDGPLPGLTLPQLASNTGTAGMPPTATDASGKAATDDGVLMPTGPNGALRPQSTPAITGGGGNISPNRIAPNDKLVAHPTLPSTVTMARQAPPPAPGSMPAPLFGSSNNSMPPGGAPPPQYGQLNSLFNPSSGSIPTQPLNRLLQPLTPSAAPAPQSSAPQSANQGQPPGAQFYKHGPGQIEFVTQGLPPGYALARVPGQGDVPLPLPNYAPPGVEIKDAGGQRTIYDKRGNTISTQAIPDVSRVTWKDVPGGQQMYQSGHAVGDPVPFSGRPQQDEAYKGDKTQMESTFQQAQAAQNNLPRLNEMADIVKQLDTGPTAQTRATAQKYLEAMGVAPERAASLTGVPSGAVADEFTKLALSTAGAAAKQDLGSNNGIQGMQAYRDSNPNMGLMPDANKRITNMMRVGTQAQVDYAQEAAQHFTPKEQQFLRGGAYDQPLSQFNQKFQAQNNPQIYSAATGILNGDAYEKWAGRLGSPDMAKRAASIAARIDPNAMVPIAGGRMVPASQILGAQ